MTDNSLSFHSSTLLNTYTKQIMKQTTDSSEYPKITRDEFIKGVGNTPLIKIKSLSNETGCDIYCKAEFFNSGKSIKDRAAIYLLNDAMSKGLVQPGGTLVEATAGNTGIALALLGRTFNPPFKVRLYVPETLVQAKIDVLETLGAKVIKCPTNVPADHPESFNNKAINYCKENEEAFHVNQMDNLENKRSHYETTGPEIWRQTDGKIDAFIAACGTGGTYAGIATSLKDVSKGEVKCYVADREFSGLHSFVQSKGTSWEHESGESFVEGVGRQSLTRNLDDLLEFTDGSFNALDSEVILMLYKLLDEENLSVGGSSGLNICCAKKLAQTLPKGSVIVTTAADAGERYASKVFNKEWLKEKGHWDKIPEHLQKYATYA